jgi:hypothetical protein
MMRVICACLVTLLVANCASSGPVETTVVCKDAVYLPTETIDELTDEAARQILADNDWLENHGCL